jgi:hypothetical protein
VIWGGPADGGWADVQWGFSFVLKWWCSEVVRGIVFFTKISTFFLFLADVSRDY